MLEYGTKFGPVLYLALKFTVCTVQCFLKRWSKEFWLASSFEGHGSSLRSLPHPSLYPRTPLIWFEQQNLFFNLRLAMIWHVFLFNFLQWLQNTQEAPCLCHSRPGWHETITVVLFFFRYNFRYASKSLLISMYFDLFSLLIWVQSLQISSRIAVLCDSLEIIYHSQCHLHRSLRNFLVLVACRRI